MKKTILSLMVLFCTVTSMNAQQLLKGDMNDDGDLTVGDVTILVDMIKIGERVYIVNPSTGMFEIDNTGLYGTWETSDNESVVIFDETEATYNAKKYSYQYYPNLRKLVLSDKDSGKTKVMLYVEKMSDSQLRIFDNKVGDFVEYLLSNKVKVESITLSQTTLELEIGDVSEPIMVTVAPEDATNKEVTWTSNDVTVATVEEGVVTAVAPGTTTITCAATDGSKVTVACEVIVTQELILITDIALSQPSFEMYVGKTKIVEVVVTPEAATNKEMDWSSSNDAVATVENGVVTGVAEGTAIITCTTTDGSDKSTSCKVVVFVEHQYVDLILPSGTLWATCNIGAEDPADIGNLFAWGEIAPKEIYSWASYKFCNGAKDKQTKYCVKASYWDGESEDPDGLTTIQPEDDAATQLWGSEWCMPTSTQLSELFATDMLKIYTTKIYNGVKVGGVEVYKTNGLKGIFIPISILDENGLSTTGYYRSTQNSFMTDFASDALQVYLEDGTIHAGIVRNQYRYKGMFIRPVRKK